MLRIGLLVAILICVVAAIRPEQTEFERAVAEAKALHASQLDCVARLVMQRSDGEARLLVHSGSAASPSAGQWATTGSKDEPTVTVYPASEPVETKLKSVGRGRLLGAMAVTSEAVPALAPGFSGDPYSLDAPAEGTGGAGPATYLLFQPEGRRELAVMAVFRARGRLGAIRVMRLPLTNTAGSNLPGGKAQVSFPDDRHASDEDPPWRAHVRLQFADQTLSFRFDLIGLIDAEDESGF